MRKEEEYRPDESSHMRAIISAWIIWALVVLGIVTSWAIQTPALKM